MFALQGDQYSGMMENFSTLGTAEESHQGGSSSPCFHLHGKLGNMASRDHQIKGMETH